MSQFTTFRYNSRGGLVMDRDSLHESEGYRRQVDALKQLRNRRAPMADTMMRNTPAPGTTIHHATFAGGATITVLRVLPPSFSDKPHGNRGWRVSVLVDRDDRGPVAKPCRIWGLDTWLQMAKESGQ